jgi:methionine-rich copper-binding protein CopC
MPFRHIHHAVLAIIMLLSTAVMAHSPLIAVTPVDGARLATAPQTIEMQFRDPSRLIRFTLAAEADGASVALDDSHLMIEAVDHTVSLPVLAAGDYTANWRAMGADGHVIRGRFSFTIAPE